MVREFSCFAYRAFKALSKIKLVIVVRYIEKPKTYEILSKEKYYFPLS
jgi:hypothetical protein